jgi:ribosome silencing factor RsfS/YbeB/iojap
LPTSTKTPSTRAPRKAAGAKPAAKRAASKSVAKKAAVKTASKAAKKPAKKVAAVKPKPIAAAKPKKVLAPKPKKPQLPTDPVERLRLRVLTALDDLKAQNVTEIDVRGKTSIADIIVVASGTSTRHVKSLADEVVRFAKQAGMAPLGVEGQREAEWVLVDLGDIVVHVMLPRVREFYGLERLWTVGDDLPRAANLE